VIATFLISFQLRCRAASRTPRTASPSAGRTSSTRAPARTAA